MSRMINRYAPARAASCTWALLTLIPLLTASAAAPYPTLGRLDPRDPQFHTLIAADAKIEQLSDGYDWSEGPVWVPTGGYLLFSDVPQNVVYRWKSGEGVSVFLRPSGYTGPSLRGGEPGSNGLVLDSQGRLVLCQHGDRQVARLEKDGRQTPLARHYLSRRFNSPNDAVYHPNGDLYFTDPPYGLEKLNDDPRKELRYNGVYRVKPDGQIDLLTTALSFPNGLGFSPDQRTLYVANSDPQRPIWMAFDVLDSGTLTNGRVFYDATALLPGRKGLPDGLKVDVQGHVFATGPGGVLVLSPAGQLLGLIDTGEATANCAWGDDGSMLYLTCDMNLCRIQTRTRGWR